MLHSPRTPILLGLGAFASICIAAAGIIVKWAADKFFPGSWPSLIDRLIPICIVTLALTGFICLAYARYIEPNWLKVEEVHLKSSKIQPGEEPIKIVQISDLHIEGESQMIKNVLREISAQAPHIIAFTGDAVNSAEGIPYFRDMMNRLSEIAPTFIIYGTGDGKLKRSKLFDKESGVTELSGRDRGVSLDIGKTRIKIIGHSWESIKVPRGSPADDTDFTLLLSHYPRVAVKLLKGSRIDLSLSGNTHGGQVRLPLLGAVSGTTEERKYLAGLFKVDNSLLYVNRGLGMSGNAPRFRFNSRPEITVFNISGEGEVSKL